MIIEEFFLHMICRIFLFYVIFLFYAKRISMNICTYIYSQKFFEELVFLQHISLHSSTHNLNFISSIKLKQTTLKFDWCTLLTNIWNKKVIKGVLITMHAVYTVGSKIIRALEIVVVKKLIFNAVLWNEYSLSDHL